MILEKLMAHFLHLKADTVQAAGHSSLYAAAVALHVHCQQAGCLSPSTPVALSSHGPGPFFHLLPHCGRMLVGV